MNLINRILERRKIVFFYPPKKFIGVLYSELDPLLKGEGVGVNMWEGDEKEKIIEVLLKICGRGSKSE